MLEESSKKLAKVNLESTQRQPMDNPKTTPVEFTCEHCDQPFKFKQSMYRHKNSCTKKNDKDDLREVIRLLNQQMEQQMDQQKKLLEIQRQEFTKILDAQGEKLEKLEHFICNVEIHDSFNTVNHIQHFHVKVLRENEESPSESELKSLFVKYSE